VPDPFSFCAREERPKASQFYRLAANERLRKLLERSVDEFPGFGARELWAALISRDVIGALKRHGLIDGSLRAPELGASFAYVTTKRFLEVFGLASLRHLPDIERLEEEGVLQKPRSDIDLDGALGILGEDDPVFEDELEFEETDEA
jgi:putative transcriptional regulator (Ypuh-like)